MENNKLFELLNTFDAKEFQEFGLFVDSPFHNTSDNAKKLYALLRMHFPDLSNSNFTKEAIFSELYPKETYKDKKIRDLFSLTNKLATEYLGYKRIRDEQFTLKDNSLEELASRDLSKHFDQVYREIEAKLNDLIVKEEKYFYCNNKLISSKRRYYVTKRTVPKAEEFYIRMEDEIDQFVLYFISKMLYYYSHQFNRVMLIKHETHFMLLDEIIGFLKNRDLDNYPYINVLYYIVMLLKDKADSNAMMKLEETLNVEHLAVTKELFKDAYIILYNCSKEFAVKGSEFHDKKSYTILKQMAMKGVLPIDNNQMDAQGFQTIVSEALSHNDFDWAKSFIEENYRKLRPEFRDNAFDYSMGLLNYRLKNYDLALTHLSKVKTDDELYDRVKLNIIKIYFETKEYERAQNVIDSFRHYLKSCKTLPDIYKKRYVTFTSYIGKVINAIHNEDFEALYFLKNEIEAQPTFEFRKWMIEQLGILLKEKEILPKNP